MATTKDSNKLTIYEGENEDYAFIPLDFSEDTYYDFTNSIIQNDASVYMKNIKHDSDLYDLIKHSIIDVSAIRDNTVDSLNYTISINDGTYNINGYLSNKMRTHIIKLYYIENFKYTLDVSQYTIENGENIDTSKRGNTYMFTITPELKKEVIDNITVSSQTPPDTGGSSGETEDPNKKYDIVFSVDGNQTLSLTRIGATNNYKLGGTLIIKYEQSDNSIKGDGGTINTNGNTYEFLIYLGSEQKKVEVQKFDGYNGTKDLWEGEIKIDLDKIEPPINYTLTPGSTINCELHMNISKDVPIFSRHGSRLNSYIAETNYGQDASNNYIFKLNDISAPNTLNAYAYFLQSTIGYYETWDKTLSNVKTNSATASGIFIIVSDDKYFNYVNISSKNTTYIPTQLDGDFKVVSTDHNSIFTSPFNNTTVVLDGPPIFLYDESNKQTKIDKINGYETDNNIFDETYFNYKSGNKFAVPASRERKKNIINLNNYKDLMYEFDSSQPHYCGTQLTNADLSAYEGKIFNVVYEVWSYEVINDDFQPSINKPIKNKDDEYVLKTMNQSSNINGKIDNIDQGTDTDGKIPITPVPWKYSENVTQYKLYSFKLSKTDPTTGVYEYTFVD